MSLEPSSIKHQVSSINIDYRLLMNQYPISDIGYRKSVLEGLVALSFDNALDTAFNFKGCGALVDAWVRLCKGWGAL